jgi:hypothetical protein
MYKKQSFDKNLKVLDLFIINHLQCFIIERNSYIYK